MKKSIFALAAAVLLSGCSKSDQVTLDGRIKAFSKAACIGGTVTRYDFAGANVYVYDDGCGANDGSAAVTDDQGNDICYLGGFNGNLLCQGKRFDSTAKNPVVVFVKQH